MTDERRDTQSGRERCGELFFEQSGYMGEVEEREECDLPPGHDGPHSRAGQGLAPLEEEP